MEVSRRSFLVGAPLGVAAAAAACSGSAPARAIINVRDHGAVGDGVADDSGALTAAAAAVVSGSTLYFPGGRYRFAQRHPPAQAAIALAGVSGVEIVFEVDAELVMDNVDPATQTGTSHGILIRGPGSNVALRDVSIRWARPSTRSEGDGIRIMGYPTDLGSAPQGWSGPATPMSGVTLSNCSVEGSPQVGVVMGGVTDIHIDGLRVRQSRGDGLHFNACRHARINGYSATQTGDDGLALVTYVSDRFAFDGDAQTFAMPVLTHWSNADFIVTNVAISGGRANGVRLAGANGVEISNLAVTGVRWGAGVIVDSAAPGADTGWHYVASRGVRLRGASFGDCETGIHILARPDPAPDERFTRFDVHVADASMRGCTNWSVRAESLSGPRMTGFRLDTCTVDTSSTSGGNGGVGLENADGVQLGSVLLRQAHPVELFSCLHASDVVMVQCRIGIESRDDSVTDPPPCIRVDASQGTFDEVAVTWPDAPPSWHPVRVTSPEIGCGDVSSAASVTIGRLDVEPDSVSHPVTRC